MCFSHCHACLFAAQLSSCPPSQLSRPALSSPFLLMRASRWRVKPKGIPSQSEYRALHHFKWENEKLVSSQTDTKDKQQQQQQFAFNMWCPGVLLWNSEKWACCSLCWRTWHLNTAFLYVDLDGRRMAGNSTPFRTPGWWKRRIPGPLWYPIMGTLQSTRESIAVTPQTNWGPPYRRRFSSTCPVSNIHLGGVCVWCSVTVHSEWFRACSPV